MPKKTGLQSEFAASSSAKDFIRSNIDRDLIRKLKDAFYPEELLAYLGLPGEKLLDILSWREYVGRFTAVEGSNNQDVADALELCVLKNRLEYMADIRYGNIDDILGTNAERGKLRWPYQIVNLDYCGGLIYKTAENTSRRLDTLNHLFAMQENVAFILFLTLNLRDKDKGEFDVLIEELVAELSSLKVINVSESIAAHLELGNAGRLKVYVPIFLLNAARKHTLTITPPVLYQGTKQMVHFAIQCLPYYGLAGGRMVKPQDYLKVINLPLLTLHDGHNLRQYDFPILEYSQ